MNNINDEEEKVNTCTSCGMCSAICPKNAINMEINKYGFYRPIINKNKCINCGLCKKVCYKYDIENEKKEINPDVYAAYSKDEEILKTSTSGGIATIIAKELLKLNYAIVGVKYDLTRNIAISKIIKSEKELDDLKGSKYIQSYTHDAFMEMINDKTSQKYVVFGLPCHIYSVRKYMKIKENRNKYVLIDLFCHGCPSMNLWQKYLKEINKKNKISDITKVNFRSKEKGWHEYCISIENKSKKYVSNSMDDFYTLFFSDLALNDSCYNCTLRSSFTYTDIRLGDFWGEKYDTNTKGISALVLCTQKGKEIFEFIKDNIVYSEEKIDIVVENQSFGKKYEIDFKMRDLILENLSNNKLSIKEATKMYKNSLNLKQKIKRNIKEIFYLVPQKNRLYIKKIYHKIKKGIN